MHGIQTERCYPEPKITHAEAPQPDYEDGPRSLRHRLNLTVLLNQRRARQSLRLAIHSSERHAVKVTEFRAEPRKTTSWAGDSLLFSECIILQMLQRLHEHAALPCSLLLRLGKQLSSYVAKRMPCRLSRAITASVQRTNTLGLRERPKGST